jgi:hypothetical protein
VTKWRIGYRFAAYLIIVIAVGSAALAFGASAYCLVGLTGFGGLQPKVGAATCQNYFDALSALLTPTIAAAAAFIAYQQHLTGQAKLKYDLYERRVAVLRGVLGFLSAVLRDGTVKGGEIPHLAKAISERRYLFNDDLTSYLEEIQRNAVAVVTKEIVFRDLPGGSQPRATLVNQQAELIAWLLEQPADVQRRFEPYLKITIS